MTKKIQAGTSPVRLEQNERTHILDAIEKTSQKISFNKLIQKKSKVYFPIVLPLNTHAIRISNEKLRMITKLLWKDIFQSDVTNYTLPKARQKNVARLRQVHNQGHHEYIAIYNSKKKPIGWMFGEMHDWETFYLRNSGVLPEYQNKKIYSTLQHYVLLYLRELGYERVISNHKPNNRAIIISKLKAGFNIEGMALDERWGPLVRVVKYLHPDRQIEYEKQFKLIHY